MVDTANSVAVIGMACRFPGADDPRAFWRNLCAATESIRLFSEEELISAGVAATIVARPDYVRAAAVLDGIEYFDAEFFGFTPREAEILDPQQRLLLECAWHAMEDAGHTCSAGVGDVGVYVGTAGSSYLHTHLMARPDLLESMGPMALLIANDKDFVAAQIAYRLNLTGPAVGISTACSTSLVAIHQAISAVQNYECDLALAGGASVKATQLEGYHYQDGGVLSPDGHCRPFSDEARGTVGGSGAALVVLKRMEDALADGDAIYAVIAGSAVNNDGADKLGITAPSVTGQAKVIREAMAVAGIDASSIGYVEAHGTGTPLGDPVELSALSQAHGPPEPGAARCALGSVKSNVGHLDAAAGVAGFIKVALALGAGEIPPTLHYRRPNPQFDLGSSRFFVADQRQPWPAISGPRRAAVSSFGIGGTNAHVVLQQAPDGAARASVDSAQVLLLSARSQAALADGRERLATALSGLPNEALADASHTLIAGRREFPHRAAVVAGTPAQAASALRGEPISARGDAVAGVVWLFAGQGAQHVRMAASLYREQARFREALDSCAAAFRTAAGIDLIAMLYPSADGCTDARELADTANTQAVMFAVQYSLAKLWLSLGHKPDLMLGHSLGEYVAACIAGVIDFDDAVRLVAARGRLVAALPHGAMRVVAAAATRVQTLLPSGASISADNAPDRCVIGGSLAAIDAAVAALDAAGIDSRALDTSHAFHSSELDPILEAFHQVVASVRLHPPKLRYLSSVTGGVADADLVADPSYWVRHLREPVRFQAAFQTIAGLQGRWMMLDMGPGGSGVALARNNGVASEDLLNGLPRPEGDSHHTWLAAVAALWCEGVPIDTSALHSAATPRRLHLPGYAFQRSRHWIDPTRPADVETPQGAGPLHRQGWEQRHLPSNLPSPPPRARLLLCDQAGLLASLLDDSQCVMVELGDGYRELGPRHYSIDPDSAADFGTMFGALAAHGIEVEEVLFGWGLDLGDRPADLARLEYAAALLVRACKRAHPAVALAWRTVVRTAFQVTGTDRVCPAHRALAAVLGVMAQEEPNWDCRTLDLGGMVDSATLRQLLLADFGRGNAEIGHSRTLALRGAYLWTPCLRAVARSAPGPTHDGECVLLLGGLGGVASQLGLLLARAGARVIAVGRRRSEAIDAPARTRLDEMLAAGITYRALDIADSCALAECLTDIAARHGRIDRIIHAAADISYDSMASFADSDRDAFTRQNRAKIDGVLALRDALAGREVGPVVLMSSLAATLGGLGLGAYAGANGFMDGLVENGEHMAGRWYSIAWDGMGAEVSDASSPLFGPEEILDLMGELLSAHPPGLYLVARGDLDRRRRHWQGGIAPTQANSTGVAIARPRDDYVAPTNATEQLLAGFYEDLIGIRPIGARDHFFELGGDSLLATQLCSRIRRQCAVDLPISAVFDSPVVAELAARVVCLVDAATIDPNELAALVASLEDLTPERVKELLAD